MQNPKILLVSGVVLCGLAIWEFARAIKTGNIKLRGGARITRERSPGIFWTNVAFQIVVFCLGFVLAVWSLSRGA